MFSHGGYELRDPLPSVIKLCALVTFNVIMLAP